MAEPAPPKLKRVGQPPQAAVTPPAQPAGNTGGLKRVQAPGGAPTPQPPRQPGGQRNLSDLISGTGPTHIVPGLKLVDDAYGPAQPGESYTPIAAPTGSAVGDMAATAMQDIKEVLPAIRGQSRRAAAEFFQAIDDFHNPTLWGKAKAALDTLGSVFNYGVSPITGTAEAIVGRPLQRFEEATLGTDPLMHLGPFSTHTSDFVANAAGDWSALGKGKDWADALDWVAGLKPWAAVKKIFSPSTVTPESAESASLVRAMAGTMAQQWEQAQGSLARYRHILDRIGPADQLHFIDQIEEGIRQPNTGLQEAADEMKRLLDARKAKIQSLGSGYLKRSIMNYFPHYWKSPSAKIQQAMEAMDKEAARLQVKGPLKGSGAFLKKRSIDSIRQGIEEHGLEPVTTNPIDLTLLKIREMDKFYYGTKLVRQLRENGLTKMVFHAFGEHAPLGWTRLDDPAFRVFLPPAEATHFASVDPGMMDPLVKIAQKLGLKIKQPIMDAYMKRTKAFGYAEAKSLDTVSRFGNDIGVLLHEVGHQLDFKFGLAKYFEKNANAWTELERLGMLRVAGTPTKEFAEYLTKPAERIANLFHAYWHAPELLERVAPTAKKMLNEFLVTQPDLKGLVESVKPTTRLEGKEIVEAFPGIRYMGEHYAPPDVSRIVNNYVSKGLSNMPFGEIAQSVRKAGNLLNMAQLGLSGFHLTFTTVDSITSKMALAVKQLSRGQLFKAAKSVAEMPIAPITNLFRGIELRNAYLNPGGATPKLQAFVDALTKGGGRIKMDTFFRGSDAGSFVQAWKNGTLTHDLVKTIKDHPFAAPVILAARTLETTTAPLMDFLVPRQKLGIFYDLARDWIGAHPFAGDAELQHAMQKAWDSVDNRMGQMVYDNVFWNKTMKDMAFIMVRSVGWNLGTLRELGGAMVDATGQVKKLARAEHAEMTDRMAYAIALPTVVATMGAITQYLYTGKPPSELIDYFYPKTGKTTPAGSPERVSIPSYMKDIFAFNQEPGQTVLNKIHPLFSMGSQWWQNRDFYGAMIYNPQDPFVKLMWDWSKWAGDQFLPFSVRGFQRQKAERTSVGASALSFLGVNPAPGYITSPEQYAKWQMIKDLPALRRKMREEAKAARPAVPEQPVVPTPPAPNPLKLKRVGGK